MKSEKAKREDVLFGDAADDDIFGTPAPAAKKKGAKKGGKKKEDDKKKKVCGGGGQYHMQICKGKRIHSTLLVSGPEKEGQGGSDGCGRRRGHLW